MSSVSTGVMKDPQMGVVIVMWPLFKIFGSLSYLWNGWS